MSHGSISRTHSSGDIWKNSNFVGSGFTLSKSDGLFSEGHHMLGQNHTEAVTATFKGEKKTIFLTPDDKAEFAKLQKEGFNFTLTDPTDGTLGNLDPIQ